MWQTLIWEYFVCILLTGVGSNWTRPRCFLSLFTFPLIQSPCQISISKWLLRWKFHFLRSAWNFRVGNSVASCCFGNDSLKNRTTIQIPTVTDGYGSLRLDGPDAREKVARRQLKSEGFVMDHSFVHVVDEKNVAIRKERLKNKKNLFFIQDQNGAHENCHHFFLSHRPGCRPGMQVCQKLKTCLVDKGIQGWALVSAHLNGEEPGAVSCQLNHQILDRLSSRLWFGLQMRKFFFLDINETNFWKCFCWEAVKYVQACETVEIEGLHKFLNWFEPLANLGIAQLLVWTLVVQHNLALASSWHRRDAPDLFAL